MLATRAATTSLAVAGRVSRRNVAAALVQQQRHHGGMPCGSGACGMGKASESGKDSGIWDSCKSDIAFKPNNSGWGFNSQYSDGWDRIFAGKKGKGGKTSEASVEQTAAQGSR